MRYDTIEFRIGKSHWQREGRGHDEREKWQECSGLGNSPRDGWILRGLCSSIEISQGEFKRRVS